MTLAASLTQAIQSLAPIMGVSIGDPADKGTWRVDFLPEATQEQRDAATACLAAFDPANVPEPIPVLTKRQFLIGLALGGFITASEAVAAAATGTPPAAISAVFDTLSADDKMAAQVTFASMTQVARDEPLVAACAASMGLTDAQVDDFFRASAQR